MRKQAGAPHLPRGWTTIVRSAVLHAVALGRWVQPERAGAGERKDRELAQLREELRIKDLRTARINPSRRPHYTAVERMAILELRAARGWSLEQTARRFQVTEPTIASWLTRLDEQGPQALVRTTEPVNKFPQFVAYLVQRLQTLQPELGKRKLAAMFARAGLHLGATTVARLLQANPAPPTVPKKEPRDEEPRSILAARPHDDWHVDLTVVPTGGGFWVPWLPWSLPQRLPFGWWVAAIVDGYSRQVHGLRCFERQPTAIEVRKVLERTVRDVGARPRYLITDRGRQFDCRTFRAWGRRRKIRVRYGAVGKHGSIAVVERFIRTLKEYLRTLCPFREPQC